MSKKANFFAIGVFVVTAAVLASVTVLVFGSGALQRDTVTFVATFRGSANGLKSGSKVKTYGVEIGAVEQVLLHLAEEDGEIVIPVLFSVDRTRFRDLTGTSAVDKDADAGYREIMDRGIHARLATESVVTGMLYIELRYGLEGEGYTLASERFADVFSIPTVPTDLEVLMRALESIIDNVGKTDIVGLVNEAEGVMTDLRADLAEIDFGAIGSGVRGMISETREKLNSPEAEKLARDFMQVAESLRNLGLLLDERAEGSVDGFDASLEQLRSSLKQLETTTNSVDDWLSPDSSIYNEAVIVLDRISDAASALDALIDYLERNPNAPLTGKKREGENP